MMAADQRKKRPTAPFGCGMQEDYRAKRREFRTLQYDVNNNSHVSLKWDDNEKAVVAKKDQIGISSRHFTAFDPISNSNLADVVEIPKEIFELDDLAEVLTYENWQSLLTDKDRNLLVQFLPGGFESNEVVKALLGCENFHFGNPFLKWGSSLCSGNLHPDAVVQYEKSFKDSKKTYYSELQHYHDNMIRKLQKLKEMCESSKDPESEILKLMSRPKGHAEKNVLSDSNGFSSQKFESNAMYESTSSIADDKSYYSDNQKLSVIRDAEIQRRIRNQETTKDKHEKLSSSPNSLKGLPRPKKAEKSQKANIASNDGTKYMSYVKISKKQHEELVLSMGQSGPVIQPKNLNRLLGSLDSYNVKPYVMFEEEEQMRIHEHWTNLVYSDLPAAFQKWRRVQLERLQIMGFLCQEIEDKLPVLTQNQKEKLVKPFGEGMTDAQDVDRDGVCQGDLRDHQESKCTTQGSVSDGDKPTECSSYNEISKQSLPLNIDREFDPPSLQNPIVKGKLDSSSIEKQSLQNPMLNETSKQSLALNISPEFDSSSFMNPLNVKDELDSSSINNYPPQNPQFNIKEFDPSSVKNNSLQNPLLSINKEFDPSSIKNQSHQNPLLNINKEFDPSSVSNQSLQIPRSSIKEEFDPSSMGNQSLDISHLNMKNEFGSSSMDDKSSTDNPSFDNHQEFDPMNLNSGNKQVSSGDPCSPFEQHVSQTCEVRLGISHTQTHVSSVNTMWTPIGLPESQGHTHPTVRHPQLLPKQPANLIDLDLPVGTTTQDLLNRHKNHMPYLNSYANQDRNELLLQSLILRDTFHQEQKTTGSVFHHPANVLLEPNQFPVQIRDSHLSFAVDHRQRAQGELFMNQNIHDAIFSDNNRYSIPGQERFSTLNASDWAKACTSTSTILGQDHVSTLNASDWAKVRASAPMQSQRISSGGQLNNHSWYGNDIRAAQSNWSAPHGTVFSTTNLGSGSGDQSLYSVLTQCNSLQPRPPYNNPVGLSEQMMIHSTSYGQDMATPGISMTSNPTLPQRTSPFGYLSGGEATTTTTLKNPMGWMSLGHQSSALEDPSGKPFTKSWNP